VFRSCPSDGRYQGLKSEAKISGKPKKKTYARNSAGQVATASMKLIICTSGCRKGRDGLPVVLDDIRVEFVTDSDCAELLAVFRYSCNPTHHPIIQTQW
ncbi:hypothetical protein CRM22_008702, partial [Opisthorchis felineus]